MLKGKTLLKKKMLKGKTVYDIEGKVWNQVN